VLVPDRSDFFDLGYNLPMSNYVAWMLTNVQGQAAFLSQTATTAQLQAAAANSVPGLNVAGPPQALSASQQTNAAYQAQLNALIQQIQIAQLQAQLRQITNSSNGLPTNQLALPTNTIAPTNPPTGPTNTLPAVPALPTNSAFQGVITNGFSPLGQLAQQMSGNQLSPALILQNAATAKETERVLNYMSHPVDLPHNKQVYFAIGQISVMPGWRTKKDYVCEVSSHLVYTGLGKELFKRFDAMVQHNASLQTLTNDLSTKSGTGSADGKGSTNSAESNEDYARVYANSRRANALRRAGTASSLALVAAFPFTESQVFDMQSSYRNQLNLLLNLAATYVQAGYTVDANVLINFVKQTQKDLSTRTAFPTVIPGVEADMLTYRFDPEAVAMTDPTAKEPAGGQLLLPTSIPVMILIECDKKDLELWPELSFDIETRWIPRDTRSIWANVYSGIVHNRILDRRERPSKGLDIAARIDNVDSQLLQFYDLYKPEEPNNYTLLVSFDELRRRESALKNIAIGRSTILRLPVLTPVIESVSPTSLTTYSQRKLVLYGDYLGHDKSNIEVKLGGIRLNVNSATGDTVEVGVDDWTGIPPGPADLEFRNEGGACILPQAVIVTSLSPTLAQVSPTNISSDFDDGEVVLTVSGQNLGHDTNESTVTLGGVQLNTVSVNENSLKAALPLHKLVKAGTNDLAFRSRRGASVLPQAIVVTNVLPVVNTISPTNLPVDFPGTLVVSGRHLGVGDKAKIRVRIGGVRLSVESGRNKLEAELNAPDHLLPPGTNDLVVENDLGATVVANAIAVDRGLPVINAVTPTNIPRDFTGIITLSGQNLGTRKNNPNARLGGTTLHVESARDNAVDVTLDKTSPPMVATNDLVFENDRGSFLVSKAILIKEPAPINCENRPPPADMAVTPKHGFINHTTTFTLTGSHFDPPGHSDKIKNVILGGLAASNVQVISDSVVTFDFPGLDGAGANASIASGGGKTTATLPYPDKDHAADLIVSSGCKAATLSNAVYFDMTLPNASSTNASTNAADQIFDKQAAALKALAAVQTNNPPQLSGSLRLEVGATATNATNSNFPASSSTVIIQNGQNTNASH
jgi:hypothetical protein